MKEIIILILLCFNLSSSAQWIPTKGPYGGFIDHIAVLNDTLYSNSIRGKIFTSSDNGDNWREISYGYDGSYISSMFSYGQKMYITTFNGHISYIKNGDSVWKSLPTTIPDYISSMVIISDSLMLVSTIDSGIYKSIDNGQHWTNSNNGLGSLSTNYITRDNNTLFLASYHNGIYSSTNFGQNWSKIQGLPSNTNFNVLEANHGNIIAGSTDGKIYYSDDFGNSWTNNLTLNFNLNCRKIICKDSLVFACFLWDGGMSKDSGEVYYSKDFGRTFQLFSKGYYQFRITDIEVNNGKLLAGTNGMGIIYSINFGQTWNETNKGLTGIETYKIAFQNGQPYIATNVGVFKLTTQDNWEFLFYGVNSIASDICIEDTTIMVGGDGVMLSYDSGVNWINKNSGFNSSGNRIECVLKNGNDFYAGSANGFWYSTLNSTWSMQNQGIYSNPAAKALGKSKNRIYAGTTMSKIFSSINNGVSWQGYNGVPGNTDGSDFASIGDTVLVVSRAYGLYYTINGSNQLTKINGGPSSYEVTSLATNKNNLLVGTWGGGIFYRNINDISWTLLNDGLKSRVISTVRTTDSIAYLAEYDGKVYRRNLLDLFTNSPNTSEENFIIYPNPADNFINISTKNYQVYSINIFNSLGYIVFNAKNEHHMNKIDISSLSSGIYYIELLTENKLIRQKILKL